MRNRFLSVVPLLSCLMVTGFSSPALSQAKAEYSPEFAAQVRQYLLDNPEVIFEAIELLEAKRSRDETAAQVAAIYGPLLEAGSGIRTGSNEAATTIIEFFDYRCAVCKAMVPVIDRFVADNPDVAVVKMHLPIISPGSERAARYVLAADLVYGPDASKALHQVLYATNAPLREVVFAKAAQELSLNHDLIQEQTDNEAVSEIIDNNRDVAIGLGVAGTPVFIGPADLKQGTASEADLAVLASSEP